VESSQKDDHVTATLATRVSLGATHCCRSGHGQAFRNVRNYFSNKIYECAARSPVEFRSIDALPWSIFGCGSPGGGWWRYSIPPRLSSGWPAAQSAPGKGPSSESHQIISRECRTCGRRPTTDAARIQPRAGKACMPSLSYPQVGDRSPFASGRILCCLLLLAQRVAQPFIREHNAWRGFPFSRELGISNPQEARRPLYRLRLLAARPRKENKPLHGTSPLHLCLSTHRSRGAGECVAVLAGEGR
jgi:hypothetical protein